MSSLLIAKVVSNSSDDKYGRVKIHAEKVWSETPLVTVCNNIPLKKGDLVYVDISDGWNRPLVLGRANTKESVPSTPKAEGSILFESSNGTMWTIAYVKNDKLVIANSSEVEITIERENIYFNSPSATHALNTLVGLQDFFMAVQKDLLAVMSGANVTAWLAKYIIK